MMHKFLWYVRLWLMGVSVLITIPFYIIGFLLITGPIELGKKFSNEKDL